MKHAVLGKFIYPSKVSTAVRRSLDLLPLPPIYVATAD